MNKKVFTAAVLALAVLFAAGCSKKDTGSGAAKGKKVAIGIINAYPPFGYTDEAGNIQGYDYQVLRAVDELLPDYEFEYESVQWATLITSLREGHFDIVTSQLEKNPEREEQFLFGEEQFFDFASYLVILSGNDSITDIASMKGKRLGVVTGTNQHAFAQEYLAANPGAFEAVPYTSTSTFQSIYLNLSTGEWDASFATKFEMASVMEAYPDISLKVATNTDGEEALLTSQPTYFLFNKSQGDLVKAVDGALAALKSSGKLNEIQVQELGEVYMDFTR
ncbi:MAG: transporter substrate-binding domain-containing protein [Treponema sp.]|jgi:L-cystine transport system substrate-binding protein|nr:transporter substrate-binding domain-containing protein [Treponema sp.]